MTDTKLRFPLENLHCASCVGRAETALAAVPGVSAPNVNLATRMAMIEVAPTVATPDIRDALANVGYPATETQIVLDLEGLHWASCAGRVEEALSARPGVTEAHVNFATRRAHIDILGEDGDTTDLIAAVRAAGYEATHHKDASPQVEDSDDTESARHLRAAIIAAVLTLPVFIIEMGGHLIPSFHHWVMQTIGQQTSWGLQFLLATAVLFGSGLTFLKRGLSALARRAPDMDSLVALGALAAWGFSTIATFAPAILPDGTRAVYFEAAAVIVTLILAGRFLETRARGQAGAAIRALVQLQPQEAEVEAADGSLTPRALSDLVSGEVVLIRPGARVPSDGTVLSGTAFVDESMITGEPLPVEKKPGAALVGGTLNGAAALRMRVDQVGKDTVLARIISLVEDAQGARLPVQALADKVIRVFVPIILAIAATAMAVWLAVGGSDALGHGLVAAVSVLIVACPCAIGLATPTSIIVATGRAAELGVLFRRGDALQRLSEVCTIAFDKTCTLTEGQPTVHAIRPASGWDEAAILRLAAAAEAQSEHPLARAVLAAAKTRGIAYPKAEGVTAHVGLGVSANVGGDRVLIGNARLMAEQNIALPTSQTDRTPETVLNLAVNGTFAGAIAVTDPIKPDAAATIGALHEAGIATAMVTGDNAATARHVAQSIGLDRVEADVLPDQKQAIVKRLGTDAGPVAFVGDGINDAPALAAADVGIAMGSGTDVAIESADVVLVASRVDAVATARQISVATLRNIRQNLVWAFGYNVALIPVAAGVFYPAFGLLLSPMLAAGAMALSSVFVVTNALRLRRVGTKDPSPNVATGPTAVTRGQCLLRRGAVPFKP